MIICSVCGSENREGDAFCGVCGSFLEWEGRKVDSQAEPALVAAEADEAEAAEKGLVGRVVERITGTEDERVEAAVPEDIAPDEVAIIEDEPDEAAALAAETQERALLAAEAAERARVEADKRARVEAEAAEAARRQAEAAEQARQRAHDAAEREATDAERLRTELEQAEASRTEAQEQLQRQREELERLQAEMEQARSEAEQAAAAEAQQRAEEAEEARRAAEERLATEREAVQRARKEAEAAEAARRTAEEQAKADAEAAAEAARQAAEADKARQEAEAKAAAEAEAAERARRAAALVAKPRPKPPAAAKPAAATAKAVKPTQPAKAPRAVKPAQTKVRPAPKRQQPPSRKIRAGDLICGNCGEGNEPTRNFCRRCGQGLKDAVVARGAWWRRLLPFRRRTYAAGERRGRRAKRRGALGKAREGRRKVLRVLATFSRVALVLGMLGIAGLSIGPWRPTVMNWAGERFSAIRQVIAPQFEPVLAQTAEASSERAEHPATNVIDTHSNTWWAGAAPGEGTDTSLVITFPRPVDIAVVGVISGAADVSAFANLARPSRLHLLFDNGYDIELELADRHEFQSFQIDADRATGVSNVLVRVTDVYEGQAGGDVAITEIEFKTRR
jgi:hypothetical protein